MSEDLAIPEGDEELFLAGLEDFDEAEDGSIPRMYIDHGTSKFVDSLSQEETNPLRVVLLGMRRQRVLWPPTMSDEPGPPLCKSVAPKLGGRPGEEFPWTESGFDKAAHEDGDLLSCDSCRLKDWGSHPTSDTPWCAEQFVFPALVAGGAPEMLPEERPLMATILTFQRATLAASKKYVQSFQRNKTPMFTAWTEIKLAPAKKGSVVYSTATFRKMKSEEIGDAGLRQLGTDDWRPFAERFKQIEAIIKSGPSETPAELEASPKAKAVAAAPAAVGEMSDDDIPFED